MATKKISLKVPTAIEVGNVDVEFEVRDGNALMGTLSISRGGVDWKAANKRSANTVTWKGFADMMAPEPAVSTRRATPVTLARNPRAPRSVAAAATTATSKPPVTPRSPKAATAVAPAPAGADPRDIRAWAESQGISVNARGRLAQAVVESYLAAHS